jgi:hypothetical protein
VTYDIKRQVLLPLQTDPLLSSLYRTPKAQRNASPCGQNGKPSLSAMQVSAYHIDVRTVALRSFRDSVILPLFPRLLACLSLPNRQDQFPDGAETQQPRLQQMYVALHPFSLQRTYFPAGCSCSHRKGGHAHCPSHSHLPRRSPRQVK